MLTLDAEDYTALGYGDPMERLALSGWAERKLAESEEAVRTYQRTPRGRARRAEAQARYRRTPKGKATQQRYLDRKGYDTMRAYRHTPKGRAAKARANARYRARVKARQLDNQKKDR